MLAGRRPPPQLSPGRRRRGARPRGGDVSEKQQPLVGCCCQGREDEFARAVSQLHFAFLASQDCKVSEEELLRLI